MFTEHIGNLHSATSLDQLKQVLEQILGDCESALTHNGTLDINGALKAGATGAVVNINNGYIAPNDATTEPDDNGNLPNGWALAVDGGAWFKGQVKFDQGGGGIVNFADWLAILPIGWQMQWPDVGTIPSGWAIMDGVANSAGSGIDRGGRVGMGYVSGDPTFGTLGAAVSIALATSFSGSSTSAVTIDTAVTGISISLHEETGSPFNTGGSTASITPSALLEHFDAGSAIDFYYFDSAPSVASHTHTVAPSSIAASLANHTVTEPSAGAGHTHTATVSNSTIAGSLSIGTPTTVRPPGVVELWIEKLS